jgi:hypothetical protein
MTGRRPTARPERRSERLPNRRTTTSKKQTKYRAATFDDSVLAMSKRSPRVGLNSSSKAEAKRRRYRSSRRWCAWTDRLRRWLFAFEEVLNPAAYLLRSLLLRGAQYVGKDVGLFFAVLLMFVIPKWFRQNAMQLIPSDRPLQLDETSSEVRAVDKSKDDRHDRTPLFDQCSQPALIRFQSFVARI